MDTVTSRLARKDGLVMVASTAYRHAHWEFYKNLRDGCTNQLTNTAEPPWPGITKMLLYDLHVGSWNEVSSRDLSLGSFGPRGAVSMDAKITSIAVLVHAAPGVEIEEAISGPDNYVASDQDEQAVCGNEYGEISPRPTWT